MMDEDMGTHVREKIKVVTMITKNVVDNSSLVVSIFVKEKKNS